MSLFNLLSVSASGMAAQRARAEVIVENLANSETTRTSEGGPYRRKDVVFESEPQGSPFSAVFQTEISDGSMGVGVSQVLEDTRPPDMRYQPGHPHADAKGYVAYPHVSPAEEMVDLMGATRGYQANVAAISAVKDMVAKSIDLMR
ncbi:flagellar basal body rod protein FlgC [uncultured Paludibaculum sp.]|uniref:flagellar basal body rod protein FlgC n=1 Tax=uncultured Paludibaculum sp. TaxID=1765020 RepID=UPI002AAACF4E|nr:flagellar basal body rod protein FlgC [uncultured Paludibaculum sp.]